jgi:hypothetical protein
MREIVRQGLVDIMLMSASSNDALARHEGLFTDSAVTAAVRANDSTDIHVLAGAPYPAQPSRPFRTSRVDEIMRGGTDLALYSITPSADAERDAMALEAYRDFRAEAERAGLRHFLEVFAPNVPVPVPDIGRFLNDFIARTLAGVPGTGRPVFLKMPYCGPKAMEALIAYDPHLVPGVLGGSAGTTRDAFRLVEDARRHGARAALFGRKINRSEHQTTFVRYLRAVADGQVDAANACRAYHADLERLGIRPFRPLSDDLQITDPVLAGVCD